MIAQNTYTYDLAGNRTQVSQTWGNPSLHFMYPTNISYLYDSLNRLTTESQTEWECPHEWFYSYDSVGNRTQRVYVYEGVFTTINNYGYNNLNQLTSNGSTNYTYDNNGNEITRGSNSLGWNYENLMTSYSSTINYLYDSLGKRVWKQNNTNYTRYFFDGINPLMEKGSSNNSTFTTSAVYTLAPGVIGEIISVHQNGTDYFYHYDPIGNVLFVSDTSGNINTDYGQDGFGNVYLTYGPAPTNYYHLTTKEQDPDIDLYYFSARWYDPSVGRFISEDLIDNVNPYVYVENNPLNQVDPLGLEGSNASNPPKNPNGGWWNRFRNYLKDKWNNFWKDPLKNTTEQCVNYLDSKKPGIPIPTVPLAQAGIAACNTLNDAPNCAKKCTVDVMGTPVLNNDCYWKCIKGDVANVIKPCISISVNPM